MSESFNLRGPARWNESRSCERTIVIERVIRPERTKKGERVISIERTNPKERVIAVE